MTSLDQRFTTESTTAITEVEVCSRCQGSGLEPCRYGRRCDSMPKHQCNNDVKAAQHRKYGLCVDCAGEGVPA